MKKGIMGETLVFFVSVFAIVLLVLVFFVLFRVGGRIENVIREERLNEQSLMLVDLLKTKLLTLDELEKVDKTGLNIGGMADTALKVLKDNEILWKEKNYADFLIELYELKIDIGKKNLVFKIVTFSLLKGMNNIRVAVEYPNFIAQVDIGEMKYSLPASPLSIDIPLGDGNLVKVKWYGVEK